MSFRTLPILVVLALVMVVAATSCDHGLTPHDSVSLGEGQPAGSVDLDAPGIDAPLPAALSPAPFRHPSGKEVPSRSAPTPPHAPLPTPQQSAQQPATLVIRSGRVVVEVDSVQAGIARVRRLAQESGALVANTTIHAGRQQQRSASLELRVPSDRFDALVNGLAPVGKVESVNILTQDVGEEFVDLSARLANARRLEARLIELLASRAGRLADVLAVERELARIREEIERYEGRLRYLQARVSVSSLTVLVHEPPPIVATHPGQNVITDAFVEAWRRFVLLTAAFIASLGVLIPLAAIALGALLLWRRLGAHRSSRTVAEHA